MLSVAWTRVAVALAPRKRSLSIAPIGNIGPFAAGRDCSRIQPALAKLQRGPADVLAPRSVTDNPVIWPHLQIELLLTRQILCAHHHTEWVDLDFNRGRSRRIAITAAGKPYCKTSQDQHTGDNRSERGLAHLVSLSSNGHDRPRAAVLNVRLWAQNGHAVGQPAILGVKPTWRIYEYTPFFCNGPGDVKSPRVMSRRRAHASVRGRRQAATLCCQRER